MPLSSKRRTCQLFEVTSIELFFCISCLCAIHYSTLPNCWGIHLHYSTLPQLLGRFTSNWYRLRLYTTLCKDLQRGFQVFACYVVCAKFGGIQYHQMWLCCFVLVTWTAMVDLINMPLAT